METRRRTWFDDRGLVIATAGPAGGARPLPFYAGAMHYWRVERSTWTACLRAIHAMGLAIVETYVPWRVHGPSPGAFDFTGARDLGAFLDAAHAVGLAVVVRPGPHINAELTSFGIPDHILAVPEHQARTSHGTPCWVPAPPRAFPIPSYASTAFRARVREWYAAVAEIVRPRLAPDGPVVAIGVDNEAHMFFRLGAFDHDYHPDALAWFTESTGIAEAPRAWDAADAARCASWVRFKDHYVARALGDFAAMLDDVGLGGVARFHNAAALAPQLVDRRAIAAAIGGPVGIDAYTPRAELGHLRRTAAATVGDAAPIAIAFEAGVGWATWQPPLDHVDATRERDHLLALLAAGVRGFNIYMAVDRDRWYGAAIRADGHAEAHAAWIRTLAATLAEIAWPSLRPINAGARLALVATRADARFGLATNALDPVTPVLAQLLELGPAGSAELGTDAGAIAAARWHDAIARALELAQVPYAIVDETTPEDELARYRAVIVPTLDRVDRGLWRRLHALAEVTGSRRTVVVIGPGSPTRDELDQPLAETAAPRRTGRIRATSRDDLPGLAADLAALAGELPDSWQIERPDDVRAFAFAEDDGAGAVRVVFACNDCPRAVTAVLFADGAALRDPFTNERIKIVSGKATIAMPPHGIRMLLTSS